MTTARTAAFMAIFTLGGKLLGFAREMVLANFYGAGLITDAYNMAQNIPSYLLAGLVTACAVAYMPTLAGKMEGEGGIQQGSLFTSQLINFLLIICGACTVIAIIFATPLVHLFAPGFKDEAVSLTAFYLRISFFMVLCSVFIYIFEAFLQYKGVFLPQLVFGYIQNFLIIATIIISTFTSHYILIFGVVLGNIARAIFAVAKSGRLGYRYTLSFEFGSTVKTVAALSIPIFIGGYVTQINTMIDRLLASGLVTGSISALQYGNLIVGMFTALTTTIIVTVLYPKLNKAFAESDFARISDISERCMNLCFTITMPFAMGAVAYAKPAVQALYERGAFDSAATALTSSAFACYAVGGIVFISINNIITKVYYSMHDTKTAVKCSLISVAVNIVLNLLLVKVMAHAGLALATSISQIVNTGLLYFTFRRRYPHICLLSSVRKAGQVCLFSLGSVGISYGLWVALGKFAGLGAMSTGFIQQVISLGICVAVAVAIYIGCLAIAKFDELKLIKSLIKG